MTYGGRRRRTREGGSKIGPPVAENGQKIQIKILNRGNKAKDLLKRKELALLKAQNELVFERKKAPPKRKIRLQTGDL